MNAYKIAFVAVALSCAAGCATRSTEANEVGVRANKLTGIDQTLYAPGGTYFFFPFVNDWYVFTTKTQALEMKLQPGADVKEDVEFKTRDGNDVGVDVTVLYRIDPQQAPMILQKVAASDDEIREKVVLPLARSLVRDALNMLTSEDIYTEKKFQAGHAAVTTLNAAFKPYGLVCENITLGDHRFDEEYQKAIVNKKVFDQQVNTNRSATESAHGRWAANLEKVKGDVDQQIAQTRGEAEQAKLSADAYFYSKQKEAEAILAQKSNQAKGVIELNRAMASSGGRTNVKLRIAKALLGKKIVILPGGGSTVGMQKIDLNELIRTAMSQEALGSPKAAAAQAE